MTMTSVLSLVMYLHRPSMATLVWCYGWLTAVTTGLGVVPFLCVQQGRLSEQRLWLGIANAVASGMMTAASVALIYEGWTSRDVTPQSTTIHIQDVESRGMTQVRLVAGVVFGATFIWVSKQ